MTSSNNNDDNNDDIPTENMIKTLQVQDSNMNLSSLPDFILDWIESTTNEIVFIWDRDGQVLYISKSVEWLLGYKPNDVKGISWFDLVSEDDLDDIKKNFNKETNEKQLFNIHIRHQDERYIWCECIIGKIQDDRSEKCFYISIIKDITDKKEIEEMMIRSEKMSIAGQLAAGVAHEIRNPLTAIKGFLQLLQAGVSRKDAYYKIMIDEIEKMETITSELLFISKPLTDNKQIEPVSEMVDDVVALLLPQAKLKDINIICEQAVDHYIYCDRSQIKQVLINLVKNAIEAMENPGNITIGVQRNSLEIEIDIIDEGRGIREEVIHKLGEPFFTTKQSGTGLGLMITKQILERHSARMEVFQNKDRGSTFRIIFTNPET